MTVQEMHPDLSYKDRFVVENFANDPESAVSYLKGKYPNLEVKHDPESGDYKLKRKDESVYKVLNPKSSLFSTDYLHDPKEFLMDLGDQTANLAKGVGTTAASAAAGVAAAPLTMTGAPLVAAAGAGAGANAAGETLRQQIGKWLGVNQEIKPGDVGWDAIAGAATPLIAGTGASKSAMEAAGLSPADMLRQRGAVGRGWDWSKQNVFPWVGQKATGVAKDTIKTLGNKWEDFKKLVQTPEMAVTNYIQEGADKLSQNMADAKTQSYGAFKENVAKGLPVDLTKVRAPLEAAVSQAESIAADNPTAANITNAKALRSQLENFFAKQLPEGTQGPAQLLDQATPEGAVKLGQQLNNLAQFSNEAPNSLGVGTRFGPSTTAAEKELAVLGGRMKGN
jgi:hypothetical protein